MSVGKLLSFDFENKLIVIKLNKIPRVNFNEGQEVDVHFKKTLFSGI